ncbi:MAG: MFS transporter [Actinomycetota bacterium]|nr:MFS transporter [Actinomycetota bacterium]
MSSTRTVHKGWLLGVLLGQSHGYRRVFMLGVGVFSLASLFCGVAPSPIALVIARVMQGIGAALMFPQTLTGIQLNFTGGERVRAIGLYAVALSTGAVVGQILGGALISANIAGTEWRAIFLINVPIGAAVILAGLHHMPADEQRAARRVDLPASRSSQPACSYSCCHSPWAKARGGQCGPGCPWSPACLPSRCFSPSRNASPPMVARHWSTCM